jgi:hypothetical protein
VPLPNRHRRYFETADVLSIRESIKALVELVLPVGRITTGGHPAITPLIALFVAEAGLPSDRLTIFQSRYFEGAFPEANQRFGDVRLVDAVAGYRDASLLRMREEMLRSQQFDAAVFVGGMEGVVEEADLFREIHPNAIMLPVASTGAAASEVFNAGDYPPAYAAELTYPTLFRHYLPLDA